MHGSSMHQVLMKNVCFLDQSKHAKMQWLQDPNQSTLDNLNNVDIQEQKQRISES